MLPRKSIITVLLSLVLLLIAGGCRTQRQAQLSASVATDTVAVREARRATVRLDSLLSVSAFTFDTLAVELRGDTLIRLRAVKGCIRSRRSETHTEAAELIERDTLRISSAQTQTSVTATTTTAFASPPNGTIISIITLAALGGLVIVLLKFR